MVKGHCTRLAESKKWVLLTTLLVALAMVGAGVGIFFAAGGGSGGDPSGTSVGDGDTNKEPAATASPTSVFPTASPVPSLVPSDMPSLSPSSSLRPSERPSVSPTDTIRPSSTPTLQPSFSLKPSISPTTSQQPSSSPSESLEPTTAYERTTTVFYAIADVPYNSREAAALPGMAASVPDDAEFLVHLGDIKAADESCSVSQFSRVANSLRNSPVPVFLVIGDNEYNDCSRPYEALNYWKAVFGYFDQEWTHKLNVTRPADRTENFYFINKRTLFIGVNVPGGDIFSSDEWNSRLEWLADWTINLIHKHVKSGDYPEADGVVIFGHANPDSKHNRYFRPLESYIEDVLDNEVPILYMCGDTHKWLVEDDFYGQSNWLRIRLAGGSWDPPLKMMVDPTTYDEADDAFEYERYWDD